MATGNPQSSWENHRSCGVLGGIFGARHGHWRSSWTEKPMATIPKDSLKNVLKVNTNGILYTKSSGSIYILISFFLGDLIALQAAASRPPWPS